MERIKDQLNGYSWKFKLGERVRLAMEPGYGATMLVVNRGIGEEITGAFTEVYDCRRSDGYLTRLYAAELVSAEKE
jgi:hypothetical protein